MRSAKKDHKLEAERIMNVLSNLSMFKFMQGVSGKIETKTAFWSSPEQPPSNSPSSPNAVAPKVLVSISDTAE